jgi:hypothetical protein
MRAGDQAEIELSLGPQGSLKTTRDARHRAACAQLGAFRRLETVYYDTPERLPFQHGMRRYACDANGKHFIQTLRLPPGIGQQR